MTESVSGGIVQIAYRVHDLPRAMAYWQGIHRAGPFFLADDPRPLPSDRAAAESAGAPWTSAGLPARYDHRPAFAQCGDVMIELVELLHLDAAAIPDGFRTAVPGLHHVARFVPDLDAESARLEAAGHAEILRIDSAGSELRFYDTVDALGHYLETYADDAESIHELFARVREAAVDWDGTDPVRPL